MKTMKKKIFTKATFLFLALMMMLAPLTLGVLAADDTLFEHTVIDERFVSETSAMTGEYLPIVAMSTPVNPPSCSHSGTTTQVTYGCGCIISNTKCSCGFLDSSDRVFKCADH